MHLFSIISCIAVLSGIAAALVIAFDLRNRPQPMRIMNPVWILTGLWAGLPGLAAYYGFGRAAQQSRTYAAPVPAPPMHPAAMPSMQPHTPPPEAREIVQEDRLPENGMNHMRNTSNGSLPSGNNLAASAGHRDAKAVSPATTDNHGGMDTPLQNASVQSPHGSHAMHMQMSMQTGRAPRLRWQSVVLSTLHCGAGCTLADLVGEWLLYFVPVAIGGSLLAGSWATDYLLALVFGIGFQYAAIRGMEHIPRGKAVVRAAKADVLSLTAWQIGMYGWMAIAIFAIGNGIPAPRTSFRFWFMMQIAMGCGFLLSLPVNVWLIRKGIKSQM